MITRATTTIENTHIDTISNIQPQDKKTTTATTPHPERPSR